MSSFLPFSHWYLLTGNSNSPSLKSALYFHCLVSSSTPEVVKPFSKRQMPHTCLLTQNFLNHVGPAVVTYMSCFDECVTLGHTEFRFLCSNLLFLSRHLVFLTMMTRNTFVPHNVKSFHRFFSLFSRYFC